MRCSDHSPQFTTSLVVTLTAMQICIILLSSQVSETSREDFTNRKKRFFPSLLYDDKLRVTTARVLYGVATYKTVSVFYVNASLPFPLIPSHVPPLERLSNL